MNEKIAKELIDIAKSLIGSREPKDRRLVMLQKKVKDAQDTLNFKYDMGQGGAIKQADEAYKKALQELSDYVNQK